MGGTGWGGSGDGLRYRRFTYWIIIYSLTHFNYMYCKILRAENWGHVDRLHLKFCGSKPQSSLACFLKLGFFMSLLQLVSSSHVHNVACTRHFGCHDRRHDNKSSNEIQSFLWRLRLNSVLVSLAEHWWSMHCEGTVNTSYGLWPFFWAVYFEQQTASRFIYYVGHTWRTLSTNLFLSGSKYLKG